MCNILKRILNNFETENQWPYLIYYIHVGTIYLNLVGQNKLKGLKIVTIKTSNGLKILVKLIYMYHSLFIPSWLCAAHKHQIHIWTSTGFSVSAKSFHLSHS